MNKDIELLTERINDLESEIVELKNLLSLPKQPATKPNNSLLNPILVGILKGTMVVVSARTSILEQLANYQLTFNNNQTLTQLVLSTIPKLTSKKNDEHSNKKPS